MNRSLIILVASIGALIGLVWLMPSNRPLPVGPSAKSAGGDSANAPTSLVVFCAASNRAVMEAVRTDYEKEFGFPVDVQYGPSQTLLANLEVSGSADLYLPADDSYLDLGHEKQLVAETIPVATMQAVLAVSKTTGTKFASLADVVASDQRLVQANPEAAAIGTMTKKLLTASGQWDAVASKTVAYKGTVNEVANDVKIGAADVGIVYDAVLTTYPDLIAVPVPELEPLTATIAIGVVQTSSQPRRALHFARYLAAPEKGLKRYEEFGFRTLPGDPWTETLEITLYSGSMLRPAIEKTLAEFQDREGARVTTVFNGCGILVAQMKAGQVPDAYFACDAEFMQQVQDIFLSPVDVSQNELVILVPKGNPQRIKSLADLTQEGLRVGIGHEKQCAMGWLTQKTLKEGGVQTDVMKNVIVQTPTGDMLVNQMRAGSLDAAVAYLSNAAGAGKDLDAIRITNIPCSVATQPYAVANQSKFPRLAMRLQERLRSAESRSLFESNGFVWKAGLIKSTLTTKD
jgi:molybdate transport system substrate-binding protein